MAMPAERRGMDSSKDVAVAIGSLSHHLTELNTVVDSFRVLLLQNKEAGEGLKSFIPTVHAVTRAAYEFRRAIAEMTKAAQTAAKQQGDKLAAFHRLFGEGSSGHGSGAGMEALYRVAEKSVGPLNMLVGAMDKMVAAASPDVWATFTGSLRMVAMVVGSMLVPYFVQGAMWAQQFARWLQRLSPEAKQAVAVLMLVTGGLLALASVAPMAVGAVKLLIPVFLGVASVAYRLGTAIGVLSSAMIVGVGVVLASIARLHSLADLYAQDDKHHSDRAAAGAAGAENSDLMKEAMKLDSSKRNEFVNQAIRARVSEHAAAVKAENDAILSDDKRSVAARMRDNDPATRGARNRTAETQNRVSEALRVRELLHGVKPKDQSGDANDIGEKLMLALKTQGQPSFGQIDDVYKKIQVNALKDNAMEVWMKEMMNSMRDQLMQINAKTNNPLR